MNQEEKKFIPPEKPITSAERAIHALDQALANGQTLSPEYLSYLEHLLESQKNRTKSVKQPKPAHQTPITAITASVTTYEKIALDGPWKMYWDSTSLEEFQRLTPEEKKYIDEMANRLAQQTAVLKSSITKPLGNTKMYSQDWCKISIKNAEYDMATVINQIKQSLPPEIIKFNEESHNENIIQIHDFPNHNQWAVIRCNFITAPGTSECDNRGVIHEYWIVIPKGSIYLELKAGKNIRLFPFVLKIASAIIDPTKSVFLDGSFAGEDGIFGSGNNPMTVIDYSDKKIVRLSETRTSETLPTIKIAANNQELAQYLNTTTTKGRGQKLPFNRYELGFPDTSDRHYPRAKQPK